MRKNVRMHGNSHDLSQMAVAKPRISKTNAKKQN
jgi:hypothetical protein